MTHRLLDEILSAACVGDPYCHTYTQKLPLAVLMLEEVGRRGTRDSQFLRITLPAAVDGKARAIRLPEGTEVVGVGTEVRGNFHPMSENPAMILASDECMRLVPAGSGHPDPDPQFVADGPATAVWPLVPGVGSGRGYNGYWKWWRDLGILQIDGVNTHAEIIVKAVMPVYTPGVKTMVDARLEPAIHAYLRWIEAKADGVVIHNMMKAERESIQGLEQEYYGKLRLALKSIRGVTLHYIIEAIRSK